MAISKVTLNGVTQMDVTQDTVDEDNLLAGETATKADGVRTTGTLQCDPNYLQSTGDSTDRTSDILSMLTNNKICRLGPGRFDISNLQMPTGSSIVGCGYATDVRMSGSSDGFAIKMYDYCSISDIRLRGSTSTPSFTATEGGRHGIVWGDIYIVRGLVSNVQIENFSGGGIRCNNTGVYTNGCIEVTNSYIQSCWAGIDIAYNSEYHKFSNIKCRGCYVGCVNNGGNNMFANCDFSTNKEIGMLMDNSQGQSPNNTHGGCVGCVFNHTQSNGVDNSGIGIKILGGGNGFSFTGCQIYYSKTYIDNSVGIIFTGCNFGSTNCDITVIGGSNSNSVSLLFTSNTCSGSSNVPITKSNNPNIKIANCYNRDTGADWSA